MLYSTLGRRSVRLARIGTVSSDKPVTAATLPINDAPRG